MSGMNDGVSKLWVLTTRHGLNIDGFRTVDEAISHLVRVAMTQDSSPERKAQIRAAVEGSLSHMDDLSPDDEQGDDEDGES